MSARTTNTQIAAKLDQLIDILTAQAMPRNEVPVLQPEVPAKQDSIQIDAKYKGVMEGKAQDYANKYGQSAVLYARLNTKGETKLAFATAEKYKNLRDRGHLGAIGTFKPAA